MLDLLAGGRASERKSRASLCARSRRLSLRVRHGRTLTGLGATAAHSAAGKLHVKRARRNCCERALESAAGWWKRAGICCCGRCFVGPPFAGPIRPVPVACSLARRPTFAGRNQQTAATKTKTTNKGARRVHAAGDWPRHPNRSMARSVAPPSNGALQSQETAPLTMRSAGATC